MPIFLNIIFHILIICYFPLMPVFMRVIRMRPILARIRPDLFIIPWAISSVVVRRECEQVLTMMAELAFVWRRFVCAY
jgi:hypothetical protein